MKTIFHSEIKPADEFNAPLCITLSYGLRRNEFVTHVRNEQTQGLSNGHYFDNLPNALSDYRQRCGKYGLTPYVAYLA